MSKKITKNKHQKRSAPPSYLNALGMGIWMSAAILSILITGVMVLGVSIFGLPSTPSSQENVAIPAQYVSDYVAGNGPTYALTLRDTSLAVGKDSAILVEVDSKGLPIDGVDVAVTIDESKVDVVDISYGNSFDRYRVARAQNRLIISGWLEAAEDTFTGKSVLARITIRPKSTTASSIQPVCTQGKTDESNFSYNGEDLIDCTTLSVLNLNSIAASSTGNSSSCTLPAAPSLVEAKPGPAHGQVVLTWNQVAGADYYSIAFGTKWLDFEYGASNVGNTGTYVVNYLTPGTAYYFVVRAVNACGASAMSEGKASYSGSTPTLEDSNSAATAIATDTSSTTGGYTWTSGTQNSGDKGYDPSSATSGGGFDTVDSEADSSSEASEATDSIVDEDSDGPVTLIPSAPPPASTGEAIVSKIINYLPWIGLGVLLLLAVFLLLYVRGKRHQLEYYDEVLETPNSQPVGADEPMIPQGVAQPHPSTPIGPPPFADRGEQDEITILTDK